VRRDLQFFKDFFQLFSFRKQINELVKHADFAHQGILNGFDPNVADCTGNEIRIGIHMRGFLKEGFECDI